MRAISKRVCWPLLGWVWAIAAFGYAEDRFTQEQLAFFETRIRPVLIEHCYECHSANGKKLKGGLRVDSSESLSRGGDSGEARVPGHPGESLLIEAVRYESLEMPPRGKLPDKIIADLVQWVEMGAPDPRKDQPTIILPNKESPKNHWAFRPITDPPRPSVRDSDWPTIDSDCFILNKLERDELQPVQDADRYTWLRRVSLDLTGLPPTLDEIRHFVNDTTNSAHQTVVDRLLASRAFGERWARHWLDLVGYADQIGTSNNVFAEHAWRYRDYVIDSFNHDVPFDRFVREQIAGDLLTYETAEERAAAITATGFLVLGDLEIVEADKAKMRVDIVDQQVVKTSRAFLGMTVGCARCHDHKFDPITQRDYYAMAGFFYSSESVYKTDRGVWSDVVHRDLPESREQSVTRAKRQRLHTQQLTQWKVERATAAERKSELENSIKQNHEASKDDETCPTCERDQQAEVTKQRDTLARRIGQIDRQIVHAEFFKPSVARSYGVRDLDNPTDMRITIRGNPHALADQVPRGFVQVASRPSTSIPNISAAESGRRELANWIASAENPLTARVVVNRIWQKLFGSGLVASVDYFGVRADPPSHPELLDHLATELIRNGWSQKALIRSLVLSRTYRMSSTHDDSNHASDPMNRLLWRMNRRRLDAEALRDSMLAISGQLQASSGGSALPLEFLENVGNIDPTNVNPPSFSLRKWRPEQPMQRTIYLPILRSAAQPGPAELRNVFDFPQPADFAGQRATTAVPTQALFLMNSPAVKQHAVRLAEQVTSGALDDVARLELLWLKILNRPIANEEKQQASSFVTGADEAQWVELCRALLATNEFLMTL